MNLPLSRATWRISSTYYNTLIRHIMSNKTALMCHGDTFKPTPDHQSSFEPDKLLNRLLAATSTSNILKIVHDHYRKMDDKQSVHALRVLFALQKEGNSDLSTERLVAHPDFEKICRNIKKHSGVIELGDAIDALKTLTYVGVNFKSTIVQVLLQIVKGNINHLSIPQVLFLDFLLKDIQGVPLVEALRIALPLVFEINVKSKMNDTNASLMADCLSYAIRQRLSESTINFILKRLESYPGEFDGSTARIIVNAICILPRNSSYEALVNKTCTDLVVNIDNVPIVKMELCLNRLAHRYTSRYSFYYQEVLFDTCANYIIDHNIGLKRAIGVARNMARLHHFHPRLADYISTCIFKNPNIEKDAADVYSIAVYLVLTEYKPVHWDHLKQWIKSCKNLAAENRKEILWSRFAAALCVLDIYKIDVLGRALKEDYVKHLLEKKFRSNFEQYFAIWQCLTTYKPDLVDLLPNLEPKDLVLESGVTEDFPMEGALQKALGGEQFVLTNLYSKLGIHIDHAAIFSNGAPVPFELKSVKFVEDIKLEDQSQQLVLIWAGSSFHYTINTQELRAVPKKALSILQETLKGTVMPVNVEKWQVLNDFEKIPWLKREFNERLNLSLNVSESML